MRETTHSIPTTIKYNWGIVKKYTNSDVKKILQFFNCVHVTKAENFFYLNPWAARIVKESSGNCHNYIQNIPGLVEASSAATDSEIFVYLDLASTRSYFTFVNTKGRVNYLPNWKIEKYDIDALRMNRLLNFDDNNIYLVYEGEL